MRHDEILRKLKALENPRNVAGMARYGINPKNALGVPIPVLRNFAKDAGKDHELASKLWSSGIHEARLLAGFVDDPRLVSEAQMESWVSEFDSWDVCDQVCSNLFDKTKIAHDKALEWAGRDEEFVRRAGFVLMATLSVHDKKADHKEFLKFLPLIERYSTDERNYVKKAVNWALRQIGKRNMRLNAEAVRVARVIAKSGSKSARWIAKDALRELESDAVRKRLKGKSR